MKKAPIVAAALVGVALLALPGVVGSLIEADVRARVAAIDAGPNTAAALQSFDGGWFRSTARIGLSLGPDNIAQLAGAAGTPLGVFGSLPVVVEFAHGPIAVLDGVHFGWYKMVARPDVEAARIAELTETLAVPYLFEFRGRSPYTGGLRFDADAPPFESPLAEALLRFSGATLRGTFSGSRLRADAQAGAVELTSPTGTFAVQGLQASADNELRSDYVMPGETSLSIGSISVANALQGTRPLLEAANLVMNSNVAIDPAGELLEMQLDYNIDSVRVEENELTAGELKLHVRNVDVAAVEAYSAAATDAVAAGADSAVIAAALGPHLERALKAGPSLTLDPIRFRYDNEPFQGRVELTTNPARLPAAGTLSADNPLLLLGLVNLTAEVQLSKPLAAELATFAARLQLGGDPTLPPEQLDYMAEAQSGLLLTMLVGQGVLVEDRNGYRCSLDYTDGALTLNGNPLPFGLP